MAMKISAIGRGLMAKWLYSNPVGFWFTSPSFFYGTSMHLYMSFVVDLPDIAVTKCCYLSFEAKFVPLRRWDWMWRKQRHVMQVISGHPCFYHLITIWLWLT